MDSPNYDLEDENLYTGLSSNTRIEETIYQEANVAANSSLTYSSGENCSKTRDVMDKGSTKNYFRLVRVLVVCCIVHSVLIVTIGVTLILTRNTHVIQQEPTATADLSKF